jgi:hypothetical protein
MHPQEARVGTASCVTRSFSAAPPTSISRTSASSMRPPATRRLRSMFSRDRYRRPCRTPRSPFDFTADEWIALGEVLRRTKQAWDERLEPDGYGLYSGPPSRVPRPRSRGYTLIFTSSRASMTNRTQPVVVAWESRATTTGDPTPGVPAPVARGSSAPDSSSTSL